MTTTASIIERNLTVTADDQAIDYGDPDPAFTFAYGAFVGGEGPGVIDTPPTCDVAASARDVSGSPYAIDVLGRRWTPTTRCSTRAASSSSPRPARRSRSRRPRRPAPRSATPPTTSRRRRPAASPCRVTVDPARRACARIAPAERHVHRRGHLHRDANQDGNANWLPATAPSRSRSRWRPARSTPQTIDFDPLDDAEYGDGPLIRVGDLVERPDGRVRVRDDRRLLGGWHDA